MVVRRKTPPEEYDRFAERLYSDYGGDIEDKKTFDKAFNDYMSSYGPLSTAQDTTFREEAYKAMRVLKPSLKKASTFKKAGGKDLVQDRRTDAKTIVTSKGEYIKRGAQNVDLKGYDTKRRPKPKMQDFKFIAERKVKKTGRKARVYARPDTFKRRGKDVAVLRDNKGRFVKKT